MAECKHLNEDKITQGYDYDFKNKSWSINGCCGGGCFIIYDFHFCPFCGLKLTEDTMPKSAFNCKWGSHDEDIKKKGKCEFCMRTELND